jgi:hypothetical protein
MGDKLPFNISDKFSAYGRGFVTLDRRGLGVVEDMDWTPLI